MVEIETYTKPFHNILGCFDYAVNSIYFNGFCQMQKEMNGMERMFIIKVKQEFDSFDQAAGFMPHIVTSENIAEFEIIEVE